MRRLAILTLALGLTGMSAVAFAQEAQQDVLGAHVIMMEAVGFFAGEREHLLGARREIVHRFLGHI